MSWKSIAVCTVAVMATTFTGCGTIHNLPEGGPATLFAPPETRVPFGGVRMDANVGAEFMRTAFDGRIESLVLLPIPAYILFVDLPLSAVGDTLTLPYVLYQGPSKMTPLVANPDRPASLPPPALTIPPPPPDSPAENR
jgi:uncharacterized protein YceK